MKTLLNKLNEMRKNLVAGFKKLISKIDWHKVFAIVLIAAPIVACYVKRSAIKEFGALVVEAMNELAIEAEKEAKRQRRAIRKEQFIDRLLGVRNYNINLI